MNTNLNTLYADLMELCSKSEAFYFVDQTGPEGAQYRVFTYRLASYTDFQNRNAIECRGHTFRLDGDKWVLASLPMQKFFNYGEHLGWGTDMDLSKIVTVMDKADFHGKFDGRCVVP
jgi:T4 RnlA family RNA ligase